MRDFFSHFTFPEISKKFFREYDRVRLTADVPIEGRILKKGTEGTILHCYGQKAFEVDLDGFDQFFQIDFKYLSK